MGTYSGIRVLLGMRHDGLVGRSYRDFQSGIEDKIWSKIEFKVK